LADQCGICGEAQSEPVASGSGDRKAQRGPSVQVRDLIVKPTSDKLVDFSNPS
jgi:hypothetical protein